MSQKQTKIRRMIVEKTTYWFVTYMEIAGNQVVFGSIPVWNPNSDVLKLKKTIEAIKKQSKFGGDVTILHFKKISEKQFQACI
jgi:hypothetical protein